MIALVGSGGMGHVYRARDARLSRDVAIKVIRPNAGSDAERLARFEAEARAAGALNHPNVLAVYDVGAEAGVPYIVAELLEGETLRDRLRRDGALPLRTAIDVAVQLLGGLDAAHRRDIVHRDLKPENVFVTRDGRVKILDFGLAKLTHPAAADPEARTVELLTGEGVMLGTVGYMSPEQVRGETADHRSDIFSVGVIVHEMLSGGRPFQADTAAETLTAILRHDPPELPREIPESLAQIVLRCLEKDPERRFHSAHDLRLTLEATANASGRIPTATAAAVPVRRRRRVLAAVVVAAAIALAGVAAGVLVERRTTTSSEPAYQRLTFRRGIVRTARFAPDGHTVLYGAAWDGGPAHVYTVRPESPESRPLDLSEATVLAISKSGEMALTLGPHIDGVITYGTLARVPLAGGVPRPMLEDVKFADWSPDGNELAIVRRVDGNDRLEYPAGKTLVTGTGSGLGGMAFPRVSPDGSRVAFVEYSGGLRGHVAMVDRAGTKTVVPGDYVNIFGLAWKDDEIWFTAAEQPLFRAIHAVRPGRTPRLVARVPGNVAVHDISPSGRVLLARNDDRQGLAILRPGDTLERDLSWLDASSAADLSPDGESVLFTEIGLGGGPSFAVYLRRTDGSPAARLAAGRAIALSRDGKWAIAGAPTAPSPHLDVVPTGAGETRRLAGDGLAYLNARWLNDGRIVAYAQARDGQARLYLFDGPAAQPRPITPEGVQSWAVSPDSAMVAIARRDTGITLHPIDGGEARTVPGPAGRRLVAWTGQGLLVVTDGAGTPYLLSTIHRVDPSTGREEVWRKIRPSETAGVMYLANFVATPDGRSYAYSWHRALSDLFLVDGLK